MKLKDNIAFRAEFDGTGILLNMTDGSAFYLNTNGRIICQCLEKGATREEILQKMKETFKQLPPAAPADLDAFLDKLREKDFLEEE